MLLRQPLQVSRKPIAVLRGIREVLLKSTCKRSPALRRQVFEEEAYSLQSFGEGQRKRSFLVSEIRSPVYPFVLAARFHVVDVIDVTYSKNARSNLKRGRGSRRGS